MLHLYPESANRAGRRTAITVSLSDERQPVLTLEAEPGETFDDADVDRWLSPEECRALAAMLWHAAEEAERR